MWPENQEFSQKWTSRACGFRLFRWLGPFQSEKAGARKAVWDFEIENQTAYTLSNSADNETFYLSMIDIPDVTEPIFLGSFVLPEPLLGIHSTQIPWEWP